MYCIVVFTLTHKHIHTYIRMLNCKNWCLDYTYKSSINLHFVCAVSSWCDSLLQTILTARGFKTTCIYFCIFLHHLHRGNHWASAMVLKLRCSPQTESVFLIFLIVLSRIIKFLNFWFYKQYCLWFWLLVMFILDFRHFFCQSVITWQLTPAPLCTVACTKNIFSWEYSCPGPEIHVDLCVTGICFYRLRLSVVLIKSRVQSFVVSTFRASSTNINIKSEMIQVPTAFVPHVWCRSIYYVH